MADYLPILGKLFVLVGLEAILSADNAVALATISRRLPPELQKTGLNVGLIFAYVLRMALIVGATFVMKYPIFQLLGGTYLLWLVFQHYVLSKDADGNEVEISYTHVWQSIPAIALTDLAFSLDSVATAVGVSTDTTLVIVGATIGIVLLRFMAGLFIQWLEDYTNLENAGYIAVGLVGLKLSLSYFLPSFEVPELYFIATIGSIFAWGFSHRKTIDVNLSS